MAHIKGQQHGVPTQRVLFQVISPLSYRDEKLSNMLTMVNIQTALMLLAKGQKTKCFLVFELVIHPVT